MAAGFHAFRAKGCRRRGLAAGGAVIPAAGEVLGAHHNAGDSAIAPGCGAYGFPAALRRNGSWRGGWRDPGEPFPAGRARIRRRRACSGTGVQRVARRSQRLSVWRHCAGNRSAGTAHPSSMAGRNSSVCRGIHRNCGCIDPGGRVAGPGNRPCREGLSALAVRAAPMRRGDCHARFERRGPASRFMAGRFPPISAPRPNGPIRPPPAWSLR